MDTDDTKRDTTGAGLATTDTLMPAKHTDKSDTNERKAMSGNTMQDNRSTKRRILLKTIVLIFPFVCMVSVFINVFSARTELGKQR